MHRPIGRRLARTAMCLCCGIATLLPVAVVTAEPGIPAGSDAVITTGAPIVVRAAPGWDAAISYEIAGGSAVTVWGAEQAAPDGSLWYPVDGGYVPIDAVTSTATLKGGVSLAQDVAPQTATVDWVDPAIADPAGADPQVTGQTTEPAATDAWIDPASTNAIADPPAEEGWVDPATGQWVAADPVAPAGASAELDAANVVSPGGAEVVGAPIAMAYVTGTEGSGAPCLMAPQWGTETLAHFGDGEPVEVRAETQGEWQPVNCAGAGGYLHTSFIGWEPIAAADEPLELEQKSRNRNGSSGNEIVDFALKYEGARYVYAGDGPKSFDCSGFTMFVIDKTLGIDITHDMAVQYEMGNEVRRSALEPGDLVFFKNTYRRGLSHTGIYIGDGQFIHAENESTGVTISDLDSDYYSSRWYGAARYT